MTFDEAKQKVAEKYNCRSVGGFITDSLLDINTPTIGVLYQQVAELWQQSNLERIKELEDGLRELSNIDSIQLIGNPNKRFNELEGKGWQWRSFYNGWLEGRVSYMRQLKELLK